MYMLDPRRTPFKGTAVRSLCIVFPEAKQARQSDALAAEAKAKAAAAQREAGQLASTTLTRARAQGIIGAMVETP